MSETETLDEKVRRLEADLALAHHNIATLIHWVEATIFATETSDRKKTEADRHFLRSRFNV